MKKFHFRLEKYHNFKEQEEKAARLELFRARRAYQEEADKLAALQGKTIELISQNKILLTGSIQLELLNNCIGCLAVQKNLEEEQAAAVQEKEEKNETGTAGLFGGTEGKQIIRTFIPPPVE